MGSISLGDWQVGYPLLTKIFGQGLCDVLCFFGEVVNNDAEPVVALRICVVQVLGADESLMALP